MSQITKEKVPGVSLGFEEEAKEVMTRLRGALADLINETLGDARGWQRAADVQKALGVDASLGWRVFRVATSLHPVAAGALVPGPGPMRRVLQAARERGASERNTAAAAAAYERFEAMVRRHAKNRASFDAMVGPLGGANGEAGERLAQQHKRAAYQANSYAWGIQSDACINLWVLNPDGPRQAEGCFVRGVCGLRQLRRDVPYAYRTFSRMLAYDGAEFQDDSEVVRQVGRRPLDPASYGAHGVALIEPFCSSPLPTIEAWEHEPGAAGARIRLNDLGHSAAIDIMVGEVFRLDTACDKHVDDYIASSWLSTPTELLVLDLLVPTGRSVRDSVRVKTMGDRSFNIPNAREGEMQRLPFEETAQFLGQGIEAMRLSAIPQYADLGRYVFERLGWDAASFDVYRTCVEFPFMFSEVALTVDVAD